MLITLFTDASHCHKTKIGAYAIWAKANGNTLRHSGVFKQKSADSADAELKAVINGVFVVLSVMQPAAGSRIIAQSDCLLAIRLLENPKPPKKKATRDKVSSIITEFRKRVAASGVSVEFRHVTGHKGNVTTRNAVNTWCDNECRRLMRAARTEATNKSAT